MNDTTFQLSDDGKSIVQIITPVVVTPPPVTTVLDADATANLLTSLNDQITACNNQIADAENGVTSAQVHLDEIKTKMTMQIATLQAQIDSLTTLQTQVNQSVQAQPATP